jgi:glycosyltransferase involved in cell wall biosynthesis
MRRPFLLTEHGVYLREQYLNLRRDVKSPFVRWFMYRVFTLVAQLNYTYADQVSPVCAFNARWERELGAEPAKIKVIYNGCDPKRFHPRPAQPKTRPIVSTVGLIYELKGQLDLIEAANEVRKTVPDVEFRIYGVANDEKYYAKCLEKVKQYTDHPRVSVIHFGRASNVYILVGKGGGGDGGGVSKMIEYAGGEMAGDSSGRGMQRMESPEILAQANPDVILMTDYGYDRLNGSLDQIKALPGVATSNAAKNGRIYRIEENVLNYFGPRSGENIEKVARTIHQK